MTTISPQTQISTPTHFRVKIFSDGKAIGFTESTPFLAGAEDHLARLQNAYPDSTLQALGDYGDLGDWRDVTAADLDRIVAVRTAYALAALCVEDVPRISWRIPDYKPGLLDGSAPDRDVIEQYAALLGVQVGERERSTYTVAHVEGEYRGVRVEIHCHVEKAAEVPA